MNTNLHFAADYAAEQLENYIIQHDLRPNDRLPSERRLAELFGVNRITLREAIRRLQNEHVLYSLRGSGTFVMPEKLRTNVGTNFSFTAYCEANGHIGSSRAIHFYKTLGTDYICRKLDIPAHSPIYILKRLRLLNQKPAMIETTHISAELCPSLTDFDFSNPTLSLYQILTDHYAIIPKDTSYSVSMAYSDMETAYHLAICEHTPLLSFDIISKTEDGQVIEYCQTLKRADYFGINMDLYH